MNKDNFNNDPEKSVGKANKDRCGKGFSIKGPV